MRKIRLPRRKKKLIQPGFQLRLIGKFVGLAALALALQFLLLGYLLTRSLRGAPEGAEALADQIPSVVVRTMLFSGIVLLPILFGFGVLLTSHIAGPIYRFENYLQQLARREASGPCSIRQGDELQSLCDAINEVSASIQGKEPARNERGAPVRFPLRRVN